MPLPLVPIAAIAVQVGTLAYAAYAIRRGIRPGRVDQRAEDAMDDLDEGVAVHRPKNRDQANAAARFRRVIRWGAHAVEIDASAMARFRVRRA